MFRRRCFLPAPTEPGSLQLVTLVLQSNCAPFQARCMDKALVKWQRLFTVRILDYSLSDLGAVMLVYIPNRLLSVEEAEARNSSFDSGLRSDSSRKRRVRAHHLSPQELNSLSKFMTVFCPDLRRMHKEVPVPSDLHVGFSRFPVYKKRYGAMSVQHNALPPVFSAEQLENIRRQLQALSFSSDARSCKLSDIFLSTHGIGTLPFLADLEDRCCDYLSQTGKAPVLWLRYKPKYIAPYSAEVWQQRLKELVTREAYEDHPKIWSLLMTLDMVSDELLRPECYFREFPGYASYKDHFLMMCLPISLSLLLADGLLRWYYRAKKDVEFPYYNYYRRLQPWECPRKKASIE